MRITSGIMTKGPCAIKQTDHNVRIAITPHVALSLHHPPLPLPVLDFSLHSWYHLAQVWLYKEIWVIPSSPAHKLAPQAVLLSFHHLPTPAPFSRAQMWSSQGVFLKSKAFVSPAPHLTLCTHIKSRRSSDHKCQNAVHSMPQPVQVPHQDVGSRDASML